MVPPPQPLTPFAAYGAAAAGNAHRRLHLTHGPRKFWSVVLQYYDCVMYAAL